MLRDITIGQYYPGNSFIHRLDPRTKFMFTFMFVILVFLLDSLLYQLSLFVLTLFIIFLSKVPIKFVLKGLKPILFLIVFAFIINALFTDGTTIFEFWIIKISYEGVTRAVLMATRLILLIMCTSMLTLTTSPIQLTDAIESSLSPLKVINFPAHEIAMMMTIALRFIPTLIEETDKIMKAQMARCANFETGNIINRAKSLIPILVPLFVSAFKRADELATAMESRCYRGGEFRTRLNALKYGKNDFLVMILTLLLFVSVIYIRITI